MTTVGSRCPSGSAPPCSRTTLATPGTSSLPRTAQSTSTPGAAAITATTPLPQEGSWWPSTIPPATAGPTSTFASARPESKGSAGGTGIALYSGVLYIADDAHGRIWRVTYRGPTTAGIEAAPAPSSRADNSAPGAAVPPEGIHPEAGAEAAGTLPTPRDATPAQVALGDRVFHGQVGSAPCVGCHGTNAEGTPLGPDLTSGTWLWGDGSLQSITQIITDGVPNPKEYRAAMPPMGGAQLSPSEVSAVAAYVWALSHRSGR
jgi:mono/diheme cytochrome c family protein